MVSIAHELTWAAKQLRKQEIPHPRREAELILACVFGYQREMLVLRHDAAVSDTRKQLFRELIQERGGGKPLAYLTGEREFFGLSFKVSPTVLIPRPESELLVEWALERCRVRLLQEPRIADIGTGSGCLAVALAHELPKVTIQATDISREALLLASQNALRYGVEEKITFLQGHLLEPLVGPFDLLLSNPPYVARGDARLEAHVARHEPELAYRDTLDGDGLGFYRRLAAESARLLCRAGEILLEVGENQARAVRMLFQEHGYTAESRKDLAGIERALLLTRDS